MDFEIDKFYIQMRNEFKKFGQELNKIYKKEKRK